MEVVPSIHAVPIRLTSERWIHIVENHDELAGRRDEVLDAVTDPDIVLGGKRNEYIAVRYLKPLCTVVIYREVSREDGFIITAFQTSRFNQLVKGRKVLWRRLQFEKPSK